MSNRRTNIIQTLVNAIAIATGATGFRGLRFLHEINTFPSFYLHPRNESRTHISHGVRLAIISCDLRGYVYDDQLGNVELFARQVEETVNSFAKLHLNLVDECRVTTVRTDEGVMTPYGIIDLTLEILYRIES